MIFERISPTAIVLGNNIKNVTKNVKKRQKTSKKRQKTLFLQQFLMFLGIMIFYDFYARNEILTRKKA